MYIKLTRPITGAVVDLLNAQLSVRYDCARQTVPGTANSFWQLTIRDSLTAEQKIQLIDLLESRSFLTLNANDCEHWTTQRENV